MANPKENSIQRIEKKRIFSLESTLIPPSNYADFLLGTVDILRDYKNPIWGSFGYCMQARTEHKLPGIDGRENRIIKFNYSGNDNRDERVRIAVEQFGQKLDIICPERNGEVPSWLFRPKNLNEDLPYELDLTLMFSLNMGEKTDYKLWADVENTYTGNIRISLNNYGATTKGQVSNLDDLKVTPAISIEVDDLGGREYLLDRIIDDIGKHVADTYELEGVDEELSKSIW
ncbi:hypothetical protein GOV11_02630 [Candidatus Woesearchaeota archaeon]|nr:hypothetical protein [Candidatus Woesearchaeota archaeon]